MTWEDYAKIIDDYSADPAFNHMRLPGINVVPGSGLMDAGGILFVGEAPGATENEEGMPFVGDAGEIWQRLLAILGLNRKDVFVTNVVKYRPMNPPNRDPSPYEIKSSLPYLAREINTVNPAVIVLMGRVASTAFYPSATPKNIRGKVLHRKGRLVIPTYHPAAVLYDSKVERFLEKQFQTIGDAILSY